MIWDLNILIQELSTQSLGSLLREGLYGLEKEMLRVDLQGDLSLTPHPNELGDKLRNPEITTDFSESQIELITKPFPSIEAAHEHLKQLHHVTASSLKGEWLWPLSMPARLPENENNIPIARYDDSPEGQKNELYRKGLAARYGKYMQTISGVHYNRSFSLDFWGKMRTLLAPNQALKPFINEGYLHLVRNFIRYRWLLVLFSGASPCKHESYQCKAMGKVVGSDKSHALSLRLSRCGYSNPAKIQVDYNRFDQHVQDLKKATETSHPPYTELSAKHSGEPVQLNDHLLQIGNEYYFPIRLKPPKPNNDMVEALIEHGVEYIEVRILDLNPFEPTGVNVNNLYFTDLFLMWCLLRESPPINEEDLETGTENQQKVATHGRDFSIHLKDSKLTLKEEAGEILESMKLVVTLMDQGTVDRPYSQALTHVGEALKNPELLPAFRIVNEMKKEGKDFIEYGLEKAKEYTKTFLFNNK